MLWAVSGTTVARQRFFRLHFMQNDLFLRACRGEEVPRTPVWIMRQAGRIIPEYRQLRERYSFRELLRRPSLVADITLQPVEKLGVDAAILFTDILIIPEAMGMDLTYVEGEGPVFADPVRSSSDVQSLGVARPEEDLSFVLESVDETQRWLRDQLPLIGFAGSPWTLACYMVDGESTRRNRPVKRMLYNDPGLLHELLEKITEGVIRLLRKKVETGANALQIFDTSGGTLSPRSFQTFSLRYVERIVDRLSDLEVPLIYYGKGTGPFLDRIADVGPDVIGLDWRVSLAEARERVPDSISLQGNLDPPVLYGDRDRIRKEVQTLLEEYGQGPGHIVNLGHGVYPDTDFEQVKDFVSSVHRLSTDFHPGEPDATER